MSKQKDAPAFDFYPERWSHGTRHMTKIERSDYIDLLGHQWTDDGLPADLEILARLIGYKKSVQIPSLVLEKFPLAADGRRRNPRLEIERENQRGRIENARRKGQKMAAGRWSKQCTSNAQASAMQCLEDAHHPPPTTHHRLDVNKPAADTCSLDEAKAFVSGNGVGMTPEGVEIWHSTQERNGWTVARGNGSMQPITNWKAAIRSSCAWVREALAKAQAAERRGPGAQSKSFRQQDQDAKEQARHGGEKITPKILTLEG